jgi:hypothetical protein
MAQTRESVTAHVIRLLNDGGLRRQHQPRRKITRIKAAGEHREDFDHADGEGRHIDILA